MEPSSRSDDDQPERTVTHSEADLVRGGDRGALARLLTRVERGQAEVIHRAGPHGRAQRPYVIGITGAPGAGKSTLVGAVVNEWRSRGQRTALLLVDPSSPISGGAVLGDRVRMAELATDDGVFCRSVATRGHLGGLTSTTDELIDAFGLGGWPLVIIETVGVGQVEVDIMGLADLTVVVLTPGTGDSVQASKAGLMEIGDVYVLNKADMPGLGQLRRDVQSAITQSSKGQSAKTQSAKTQSAKTQSAGHRPNEAPTAGAVGRQIFETSATRNTGIGELVDHLAEALDAGRRVENRFGSPREADTALVAALEGRFRRMVTQLRSGDRWAEAVARIMAEETPPAVEAEQFLQHYELPESSTLRSED